VTQNLKPACAAVEAATEADHVRSCSRAGRRAPLLGKFMFELCQWIAKSGKPLTEAYGREWVSYSREQWITDKEVWGKNFKPSMATFDRLLKAGKDIGLLETGQWPTALHRVGSGLDLRPHCEPYTSGCGPVANQVRSGFEPVAQP
jgi:hypothetical protein